MSIDMREAFDAIGADVLVEVAGNAFEIDVRHSGDREFYQLQYPLGDTIQAYGGHDAPRAWALIALTNDWADHYGAAAIYLRLNGLLPPTAQKK